MHCKRQGAPQRQLHLQQYSNSSLDLQEAAALDSSAHIRPGYKWDQFLLIPDAPPAGSGLKAFLKKLLPLWLHSTKSRPPALPELQPVDSDDSEPVAVNNATWVPVLPAAIAWMMHDAEDRISESGIKLSKAQLLAKLTSVSYCERNNIKAWNCSRCVLLCIHQAAYLRLPKCGVLVCPCMAVLCALPLLWSCALPLSMPFIMCTVYCCQPSIGWLSQIVSSCDALACMSAPLFPCSHVQELMHVQMHSIRQPQEVQHHHHSI